LGDIYCKVCGEPWDAYGVRHHEDMDAKEAAMLLSGRGCPSCKGKLPVDCALPDALGIPYHSVLMKPEPICPHFEWGRCKAEKCIKETDYRRPRKPISGLTFAESVVDSDDKDPLEAIAKMDKSVWRE
jgi:hypothetical protein